MSNMNIDDMAGNVAESVTSMLEDEVKQNQAGADIIEAVLQLA